MREEYEERKIRLLQVTGHKIKAILYKLFYKIRRKCFKGSDKENV